MRKLVLALAVLALFLGAAIGDAQNLKPTTSFSPSLESFLAEPQRPLSVELEGKKVEMQWRMHEYRIGDVTYKSMIFYKPGSTDDWLHYESTDEVVSKETDGRNRIHHHATIVLLRRTGIPILRRSARWEPVAEYKGFSIDDSMHLFCEKLEKLLGLSMPAGFEL